MSLEKFKGVFCALNAIYDENGELLDVINLTKKEAKEYKKDNPNYTLEEITDLEENDE